jgi:hypothetical protein
MELTGCFAPRNLSAKRQAHSMLQLDEAVAKAQEYANANGATWLERAPEGIVDRGDYWFFPVGFVGSAGIIIDKATGLLSVMGSALSRDDMFWGHENGFSGEPSTIRITSVRDMMRAVEFLLDVVSGGPGSTRDPHPRRAWLEEKLRHLPHEFRHQSLWLRIPAFRALRLEGRWFEFEVLREGPTA